MSITVISLLGRARPVDRVARQTHAFVDLALIVIGGMVCWWTDTWFAGIPVSFLLMWFYGRFLRERVEQRVTRRQRAYDATPDGRLTRDHG